MSKMNNDVMTAETPKKNWGARLFAVLLVAVCALAIAVLKFAEEKTLLDILTADLLKSETKIFGMIPAFAGATGVMGKAYTFAFYLLIAGLALAALFSLIAIFTKKAPALVRTALFFMTSGAMIYVLIDTLNNKVNAADAKLNMIALALAAAGAFLYFLFAAKKIGKVACLYFLQAILSVAVIVLLINPIVESEVFVAETVNYIAVATVAVLMLNAVISVGRMTKEAGLVFDLVRYLVALLVCVLAIAKISAATFAILAAVVVVIQIVLTVIQLVNSKKVDLDEVREEAVQQATSGFHMEEYAEAYPYEGGPVAGVLMAAEVNPSFLPHEPHVTTAGYDFYNCKSFDPFIASLDMAERNEFTELFILKFKGTMPELPDYVVGGDNREFFRLIFIYLGQYRDRMSQALLAKMYQYSIKI